MSKKLSIIISNRNDVAMLSVTVRSCIEELRPFGSDCEIIVVDNSDPQTYDLVKSALPSRYIQEGLLTLHYQPAPCLFKAREKAAELASGTYILCLDSHMIVGRDTLVNLFNFMERRKNDPTMGFAHAPINWAHHHEGNSRHDRDMSVNELGDWNKVYKNERTITWKGMPWICRRDWFLDRDRGLNAYGALADHSISWGGGDMHIGIKPWLLGFKNWAVPCNSCIHIGPFPKLDLTKDNEVKVSKNIHQHRYRLYATSGNYPHTFGFLVSCYILGGEPMMKRNKAIITKRFGNYINVEKYWKEAITIGQAERDWLLSRQKMSFEELLTSQPWDESV